MKLKHVLFLATCLGMVFTSEAQILKKLKKKAEAAVERTVLNKTDEVVTQKTEQAIDSATTSKSKDKKTNPKATSKKKTTANQTQNRAAASEGQADLHLQASVQPEATSLGGAVTFTIAVNNKGPATSDGIVSKVVIPSGYSVTNISVTQGSYNPDSQLWEVGSLGAWKRAIMTIMVVVQNDQDLMTTGEIISCSTQDPDSTPNNGIDTNGNGLIIDDRDDEDDGDGQDVTIGEVISSHGSGNNGHGNNQSETPSGKTLPNLIIDEDIKMVMEHKRDKVVSYLDFETMAMRMDYQSKGKNPDAVYWDKDGYVYAGEKGQYFKVKFNQVKGMGKNMMKMFKGPIEGMPLNIPKVNGEDVDLEWYDKPIIYNGYELYVSPNRYPMMEWVFIYRPEIFRGAPGVQEAAVSCRGSIDCVKFTVTEGEGVGSTILFDSEGRLAEITNPDGASIVYTYEQTTVTLPKNAQEYNFNFSKN